MSNTDFPTNTNPLKSRSQAKVFGSHRNWYHNTIENVPSEDFGPFASREEARASLRAYKAEGKTQAA